MADTDDRAALTCAAGQSDSVVKKTVYRKSSCCILQVLSYLNFNSLLQLKLFCKCTTTEKIFANVLVPETGNVFQCDVTTMAIGER